MQDAYCELRASCSAALLLGALLQSCHHDVVPLPTWQQQRWQWRGVVLPAAAGQAVAPHHGDRMSAIVILDFLTFTVIPKISCWKLGCIF